MSQGFVNGLSVPLQARYGGTGTAATGLLDANGNVILGYIATSSAVNYVQVFNNTTGNSVGINVAGTDSAINLNIQTKNGTVDILDGTATNPGKIRIKNTANSHGCTLSYPAAASTDPSFNLPTADAAGFMISDGSGNLSLSGTPADITGTVTVNGFSSFSTKIINYLKIGKLVYLYFNISGTSNATNFTITNMPASVSNTVYNVTLVTNNSVNATGLFTQSGTTVDFYLSMTSNVWTNSGTKSAYGSLWYQVA